MKISRVYILGAVLCVLIFSGTYFLPNQFHIEFAYSIIVLLTIWVPGNKSTFDTSVLLTGLIIVGYFFNHNTEVKTHELPFFILPIFFIWAFTFAIIKYKESQENLIKSTENLNAMFNHATEGIIISNVNGIIIMANPRANEQFGYEGQKLQGKKIEDLIPKRFSENHASHRHGYYKELHNRSMGKGMNLYAKKINGEEFPVEISLSSFRNKNELFVISFIIDITERKKQDDIIHKAQEELEHRVVERTLELETVNLSLGKANKQLQLEISERRKTLDALRDSERLYSTIARNFPDGIICVINKHFKILFIDGKELEKLDIQRDELINQQIESIDIFKFSAEEKKKLEEVFDWEATHLELTRDSEYYIINAVPLPDAKGFINEILLVVQNTTEIKNAELETLASLKKEKDLNEMKSKFVSIASHEFRTPLSTILTSVSLIDKYNSADLLEKRNRHIDRIKSSVKNLTEILNDFLSLEKLEAGKTTLHPSEFNLVHFCEEMREEMMTITKPGQIIEYNHSGQELIFTDKQFMRHVLINLINNSIKYSPENSKITIETKVESIVVISIKDDGMGIPFEDQSHLFERFFRAGNSSTIQGTGLGLNIVQRYVELMNGKIKVISEENKGSIFVIEMPQKN